MKKKKILILNGPNLNLLGKREIKLYGTKTLNDLRKECLAHARNLDVKLDFRQTNHEGVLVTWIQETLDSVDGILINAGAYSHTSLAILDALKMHSCPIVEVHLSNIREREPYRQFSFVSERADNVIMGIGFEGYFKGITWLLNGQFTKSS